MELPNPELALRTMLFNNSRYNPWAKPRTNISDIVETTLQWNFVKIIGLVSIVIQSLLGYTYSPLITTHS
jgi:hypothetical protein